MQELDEVLKEIGSYIVEQYPQLKDGSLSFRLNNESKEPTIVGTLMPVGLEEGQEIRLSDEMYSGRYRNFTFTVQVWESK